MVSFLRTASMSVALTDPTAHRDGGGTVSVAIMRCRKITIAAINGHAVGRIALILGDWESPLIINRPA